MTRLYRLRGYTAQARYMHNQIKADAAGEWIILGWYSLRGHAEAVYSTKSGLPIILVYTDGRFTVAVMAIDHADILPTEESVYEREGLVSSVQG